MTIRDALNEIAAIFDRLNEEEPDVVAASPDEELLFALWFLHNGDKHEACHAAERAVDKMVGGGNWNQ